MRCQAGEVSVRLCMVSVPFNVLRWCEALLEEFLVLDQHAVKSLGVMDKHDTSLQKRKVSIVT